MCLNLFMPYVKRHTEYYKWNTVVTVMNILRFVNYMNNNFRMKVSLATIYKMLKSQVFWDVMMCQWGRRLPITTV